MKPKPRSSRMPDSDAATETEGFVTAAAKVTPVRLRVPATVPVHSTSSNKCDWLWFHQCQNELPNRNQKTTWIRERQIFQMPGRSRSQSWLLWSMAGCPRRGQFIVQSVFLTLIFLILGTSVSGVGSSQNPSALSSPLKSSSSQSLNQNEGDLGHGHYDHPMSIGMSISGEPGEHLLPQTAFQQHHFTQPTCEPIKISLCVGLGYNDTVMPNRVGHDAQTDADALLQTFTPLIQYGCSPQLKLFLCSAYVPMCTDKVPEPIGPCRDFCLSVRSKCEPVLTEFGFNWPPSLDCDHFHPQNNHEHMCIPGQEQQQQQHQPNFGQGQGHFPPSSGSSTNHFENPFSPSTSSAASNPFSRNGGGSGGSISGASIVPGSGSGQGTKTIPFLNPLSSTPLGGAFNRFVNHGHGELDHDLGSEHLNSPISLLPPSSTHDIMGGSNSKLPGGGPHSDLDRTSVTSSSANCGGRRVASRGECWTKCGGGSSGGLSDDGVVFSSQDKILARNFLVTTALVTMVGASLAVLISTTIARRRSSPAERPILYIAFCQICYSLGVIIGTSSGGHSCMLDKYTGLSLLAKGPLTPPSCSLLFLLTFFFSVAGLLWWLLLCLSWLLSFYKGPASQLETREIASFHILTWPLASTLTVVLLLKKYIEGDELTGLCGVGYQTKELLLYYEMSPLLILVILGVLLLLLGMSLSLKERRRMRRFDNNLYQSVSVSMGHRHHAGSGLGSGSGSGRHQNQNQHHLAGLNKKEESRRAWNRVLVFALAQLLTLLVQLSVISYELGLSETDPSDPGSGSGDLPSSRSSSKSKSNLVILLLVKHSMKLVSGLLCLVWAVLLWLYFGQGPGQQFNCFPSNYFSKLTLCQQLQQQRQQQGASAVHAHSHPHPPPSDHMSSEPEQEQQEPGFGFRSRIGISFFSRIGPPGAGTGTGAEGGSAPSASISANGRSRRSGRHHNHHSHNHSHSHNTASNNGGGGGVGSLLVNNGFNINSRSLPPVPPLPIAIPVPIPVISMSMSIPAPPISPPLTCPGNGTGTGPDPDMSCSMASTIDGDCGFNDGESEVSGMMNNMNNVFCGLRTETWRRGETIV